ncbi:AIR synthase related protein domain protein [Caldicellulosiruptor saccharolyticus DSM 8903]|uniref:AIR synthase related protein domain protein n=1 Tax=Caldicellulosiruptor saccharolyticus (strain ATCC 43494 / DSM 8903 / Tp8T 6331) TaxID=351627 RepID=A4XL04_CALS8|nr:AIR synthase family protein [Caldicellulosiruptor saccharolyticus]ABP67589.1 AIR synthase related protein domain protein [Caldicellulosiruptor saccharolyticus DSM 8903]
MKIGKIPIEILKEHVFDQKIERSDILLAPGIGEDSAAVDVKSDIAVITMDPITAAGSMSGYLSVVVVCNDLAAAGAEPIGVLCTILMPPESSQEEFIQILRDIKEACKRFNIQLLGGHSEVSPIVTKPLIVSTGFGKVERDMLISTSKAKVGDKIIITKTLGIEGTFILYNEKKEKLKTFLTPEEVSEIENYINKLSVVEEGLVARKYASSMHDITEGGLFGAIYEVCKASGKGARIYEEKIVLSSSVKKISSFYNLNPYKLISSGSMLITTDKENELICELKEKGIDCYVVGEIIEEPKIEFINSSGEITLIDELPIDEIYKVV